MDKLKFRLVSPEKILFSDMVSMAVIPAAKGEMGILPKHAPMIVTLQNGIISVYEGSQVTEKIFIGGGFANINEQGCTVMADEGIYVKDIDPKEVQAYIEETLKEIEVIEEEEERLNLERNVAVARAKMEIWKKMKRK